MTTANFMNYSILIYFILSFLIFNIHLSEAMVSSSKSSLLVGMPVCLTFLASKFEKQIKKKNKIELELLLL